MNLTTHTRSISIETPSHFFPTDTRSAIIDVALPISTRSLDTRALSTVANTVSLTCHDQGLQTPGTLQHIRIINPVPLPHVRIHVH